MRFDLLHPADQIVTLMNRIYSYGMTTTSGGNLSIKTPEGDIWISPGGIDKGSLTRDDIMCVKPDGTVIGPHRPSVELPFHQHIYSIRPDIHAVLHAHPPGLVAFSNVSRIPDISLIPNMAQVCGKVAYADYGIPGSKELGDNIADVFAKGYDVVMMENHGAVLGSDSLFSAFMTFETLEFCARLEINALRIGAPKGLTEKKLAYSAQKARANVNMPEFTPEFHTAAENAARRDMCSMVKRSYDQRLFTSTEGTFSVRLDENSFLITPYHMDRKYLEVEDIVRIDNGCREAGKVPSRSVLLHKAIYDKHPEINSIILAHPPHIMAFAVTDVEFDSRTIPESYINLRTVQKIPYGSCFMQPEMVADFMTEKNPVALVENDCVIVTGTSLLNAFDRLEVAEYSAKSIIDSQVLGTVRIISDQEVEDLEEAFHLK